MTQTVAPRTDRQWLSAETLPLLAIADTKLVLGNWHLLCLFNGKSLPDYAALLAMASASFGHARALYSHLAGKGLDFTWLERGRQADEIHSLALLDASPTSWPDFIVALYLVEHATWLQASRYLQSSDRPLAALARRIGEEAYFHLKFATGWLQQLSTDSSRAEVACAALHARYAQALAWFPDPVDSSWQESSLRESFALVANEAQILLKTDLQGNQLVAQPDRAVHSSVLPLKRSTPLPAGLFERIRFKDEEAAP